MLVPGITAPSITRCVTMWPFIGTATCQVIATGPALPIWKFSICRSGTGPQTLWMSLFHDLAPTIALTVGKPAGPCGPIGPVAPVGPAGPGAPCAPAGPCGPVLPCEPAGPVGPVAPVGPAAPAGPTGPVAPA